ncbi:type II toxin-antitoxin system RelE/ParE family toxin [Leptobacterium flavescens]|uniref:Toxin n=1 Tax=Leptobacterium flavescens TaxID=472055 RepID=A0A6P0UIQ5_9FLAO|nr:type II toxin-antitoxin system RelE/ParE family toxin [Leptobacterium flavescens]NER13185.1 type II toxin-antitoxin system RelE/ParE family toxin [Leptobacterium flavescens]
MGSYKLSGAAASDIAGIFRFGIRKFGLGMADKYLDELEALFKELPDRPELAGDASVFAHNLKYYRYKAHVLFYIMEEPGRIFIIRVLGKRMDFIRHL